MWYFNIIKDSTILEFNIKDKDVKTTPMACLGDDMIRADFFMDEFYADSNIHTVFSKLIQQTFKLTAKIKTTKTGGSETVVITIAEFDISSPPYFILKKTHTESGYTVDMNFMY